MPPRTVLCDLCGGKFFAHSIEHHKKVCRDKVGTAAHECPYCHAGVPMLEMDAHVRRCPEAKAAGAKPTGVSAALATRLQRDKDRAARGLTSYTQESDSRGVGGGGFQAPDEFGDGGDARIACQVCGRKFAMDRVGKHQAICQRVTGKTRKQFQVKRTYCEGGSSGAVVGVAVVGNKSKPAKGLAAIPNPKPIKTNWREASRSFREACKAGRQYPMPIWGQDNSSSSRGRQPQSSSMRAPLPRGGGAGGGRMAATAPNVRSRVSPPQSPARARPADTNKAAQLKDQFRRLDADGNGTLDLGELSVFLRIMNPRMTDNDLKVLFANIDRDHNGRVDFNEFVDYVFAEDANPPSGVTGRPGMQPRSGSTPAATAVARRRPVVQVGLRETAPGRGARAGSNADAGRSFGRNQRF